MDEDKRREFYIMMGKSYSDFGFPDIFGWIEALLSFNKLEMTQHEMSNELSKVFDNPDTPTSVSSINRALKIMEQYKIIQKTGSRKIGYKYCRNPNYEISSSVIVGVLESSEKSLQRYSKLKNIIENTDDTELLEELNIQIEGFSFLIEILEERLSTLTKRK